MHAYYKSLLVWRGVQAIKQSNTMNFCWQIRLNMIKSFKVQNVDVIMISHLEIYEIILQYI